MHVKLQAKWLLPFLFLGTLCSQVAAHSWYPKDCCNDQDCHPLEVEDVEVTSEGYVIRDPLHAHRVYFVPHGKERDSPDGKYHVCILPTDKTDDPFDEYILGQLWNPPQPCFWVPKGGS